MNLRHCGGRLRVQPLDGGTCDQQPRGEAHEAVVGSRINDAATGGLAVVRFRSGTASKNRINVIR
jgi:hypothetical protein